MAFDDTYGPGSLAQLEEELSDWGTLEVAEITDFSEISDRWITVRHLGVDPLVASTETVFQYTEPAIWVFTSIRVEPIGEGLFTKLCIHFAVAGINREIETFAAPYVATTQAKDALTATGWIFDADGNASITPQELYDNALALEP